MPRPEANEQLNQFGSSLIRSAADWLRLLRAHLTNVRGGTSRLAMARHCGISYVVFTKRVRYSAFELEIIVRSGFYIKTIIYS